MDKIFVLDKRYFVLDKIILSWTNMILSLTKNILSGQMDRAFVLLTAKLTCTIKSCLMCQATSGYLAEFEKLRHDFKKIFFPLYGPHPQSKIHVFQEHVFSQVSKMIWPRLERKHTFRYFDIIKVGWFFFILLESTYCVGTSLLCKKTEDLNFSMY